MTPPLSAQQSKTSGQIIPIPVDANSQIVISEKEYRLLKWEIGCFRSRYEKALLREEQLKQEVKKLEGQVRDLKKRVFGKKTEKGKKKQENHRPASQKRPRGQQRGSQGHGRTSRPNLPQTYEPVEFPFAPQCPKCGLPYTLEGYVESSETFEVDVKAHKRIIKSRCAKKGCSCKGVENSILAATPAKLISKSPYGISIWEAVLLEKFHYCQPTNRLLSRYSELGMPISAGTITGGLKILKELFQPIYDALYAHQMTEDLFHNDESGWKVFESIEGKTGNRWYLWVSRSNSVVYFQIAPGRGADVPEDHFKNIKKQKKIIVVCDRYSAYKALIKALPFIVLAFCWAHVRRDFLDAARKYPELEKWAFGWVDQIAELYHINNKRCKEFNNKLPIQWQSEAFKEQHEKIVEKMEEIAQERDTFIDGYQPDDPEFKYNLLSEVKFKVNIRLVFFVIISIGYKNTLLAKIVFLWQLTKSLNFLTC